jgi:hypothetical protein
MRRFQFGHFKNCTLNGVTVSYSGNARSKAGTGGVRPIGRVIGWRLTMTGKSFRPRAVGVLRLALLLSLAFAAAFLFGVCS